MCVNLTYESIDNLLWHIIPLNPIGQKHRKSRALRSLRSIPALFVSSKHVPLFTQGWDEHGFVITSSVGNKTYRLCYSSVLDKNQNQNACVSGRFEIALLVWCQIDDINLQKVPLKVSYFSPPPHPKKKKWKILKFSLNDTKITKSFPRISVKIAYNAKNIRTLLYQKILVQSMVQTCKPALHH